MGRNMQAYREGSWNLFRFHLDGSPSSLESSVATLTIAREQAVEAARQCSPTTLRSYIKPFGFPEPAITFLRRAVDHEIHHRGELCIYAELFGTSVGDIYECERVIDQNG